MPSRMVCRRPKALAESRDQYPLSAFRPSASHHESSLGVPPLAQVRSLLLAIDGQAPVHVGAFAGSLLGVDRPRGRLSSSFAQFGKQVNKETILPAGLLYANCDRKSTDVGC